MAKQEDLEMGGRGEWELLFLVGRGWRGGARQRKAPTGAEAALPS